MAKEKKPGRVTPTATSSRYTAPIPRDVKVSPPWVPVLIAALLAVGSVLIVLNYLDVLPGGAKNLYLLVGLGLITSGFITATQWH